MAVNVLIPTALRNYVDQQSTVTLAGRTVGEILAALAEGYPDLRTHLFQDSGELRSFVDVYLGDRDIRYVEGHDTPVGVQLRHRHRLGRAARCQ